MSEAHEDEENYIIAMVVSTLQTSGNPVSPDESHSLPYFLH